MRMDITAQCRKEARLISTDGSKAVEKDAKQRKTRKVEENIQTGGEELDFGGDIDIAL